MSIWETNSPEETFELGKLIASHVCPGDVLLLRGILGSGKTTLTKGIIHALTGIEQSIIDSPTFTYVNEYTNDVYHFDFYRIQTTDTFYHLGFDEYFQGNTICLVEWPERCDGVFPPSSRILEISYVSEKKRSIRLEEK